MPSGREVAIDVKTTDRYGRSVAEVFSGGNINLAMVEDGQAFAYRQYLSSCNPKGYLDAELRGGLPQQRMTPPLTGAATAARRSAPIPAPS